MAFADSILNDNARMNDVATLLNYLAANGQWWGGTSGGSANAQTVSLTPVPTAYAAGMRIVFIAGFTNTSAATINVNSLGAKNIRVSAGSLALIGNEIGAGQVVDLVYDGTQFILQSPLFETWQTWSPSYTAGGSMTFTSVTTNYARYCRFGKTIQFSLHADGTTGGTASDTLRFTLPATAAYANWAFACWTGDGSNAVAGLSFNGSVSTGYVAKYDRSNYGLGASRSFCVSGTYEIA